MSTSEPSNQNLPEGSGESAALSFYRRFLPIVSEKTGAIGAVAWDCSSVPYKVIGQYVDAGKKMQINLTEQEHLKLLQRTNDGQQSVLFAETSTETNKQTVALSPMARQGASEIVEVVFDNTMPEQTRKDIGSALSSYCKAANQPAAQAGTGQPSDSNSTVMVIDRFAKSVHRKLDLKTTVFEIVNEMQAVVNCDRVAVLKKTGNQWKALAFSGQAELAARSNTIRDLETLASHQMKTGEALWIPSLDEPNQNEAPAGSANDGATESTTEESSVGQSSALKQSLDIYVAGAGSRELVMLPLRKQAPATPEISNANPPQADSVPQATGEIIGAVVLEQFGNESFKSKEPGIRLLTQHAESAFQNAIEHENLPFFGLVNRIGQLSTFRVRGRRNKLLMTLGVLGLIALLLAIVPIEFKVGADGILVPEQRRNVFSEVDGQVDIINAKHGAPVSKDDVLMRLTSSQLDTYIKKLEGQEKVMKEGILAYDQLIMKADQRGNDTSQTSIYNVERAKLEESINTNQAELKIAREQVGKLVVRSPIDGQVLSWQLDSQLKDRPVSRGQRLLEVANLDGPWIVEVDVPDKDIGKVLRAQRNSKSPLKVTFMLASDPGKSFEGTVEEIAEATSADQITGQTVRVKVKINKNDLDFRQVRTDVRAKIHCGKRSAGYVWLHDLFEFVQSKVLFGLF